MLLELLGHNSLCYIWYKNVYQQQVPFLAVLGAISTNSCHRHSGHLPVLPHIFLKVAFLENLQRLYLALSHVLGGCSFLLPILLSQFWFPPTVTLVGCPDWLLRLVAVVDGRLFLCLVNIQG